MDKGILILGGTDDYIRSKAKGAKLGILGGSEFAIPFEKTLILESGTRIPWDLLPAAWHFLDRWDAAIPLWRYGITAADLGTAIDREKTREIVRDLRVLVYSHELLFVKNCEAGNRLIESFNYELKSGGDKRLAFLRAFYQIKPRLCVLPVSWLAEVRDQSNRSITRNPRHLSPSRSGKTPVRYVRVEIAPGRFVKCKTGEVEEIKKYYQELNHK